MSWFSAYTNPSTSSTRSGNPLFTEEARAARRTKLEADRLLKAQRRADRQNFFKAGVSQPPSPVSLSKASSPVKRSEIKDDLLSLPDIFLIAKDVFEDINEMANFDELNADNGADAIKNLGQIKVSWDQEDPGYFFQKLETELQIYEINKQFTKRQALIRCLPDEVGKEFKHLINLQETQAGNTPYKDLKTALLKAYGPRPGAAFQKAMSRVMVSKPSVLLKLLVSDICNQNLKNCCCNSTVWGLFQMKVPMYLKTGLAFEVFNADTMHSVMDKADNLWDANQTTEVCAVSPPVTQTKPEQPQEVAAVRGRGGYRNFRGRGNRGYRGGRGGQNNSQNNQNSNSPDPRGKRHESNPPWNSCGAHWVFADSAWKCQSPTTCPLKDKVKPKNA